MVPLADKKGTQHISKQVAGREYRMADILNRFSCMKIPSPVLWIEASFEVINHKGHHIAICPAIRAPSVIARKENANHLNTISVKKES